MMKPKYPLGLFQKNPEIQCYFIAHRGATTQGMHHQLKKVPENTLPALREAYRQGAIYVECDIQLTKDEQIVVLHDETLSRTARYRESVDSMTLEHFNEVIHQPISTLNYAQFQSIDVGSYSEDLDKAYQGTPVPLLSSFIKELDGRPGRRLVIELKSSNFSLVMKLKELIDTCFQSFRLLEEQIIFIGFDYGLIRLCKARLPSHKQFFLTVSSEPDLDDVSSNAEGKSSFYHCIRHEDDLKRAISVAKQAGLDGLHLEYNETMSEHFIHLIHQNGLLCAVWNYLKDDCPQTANKLLAMGVDLINTNQLEMMFKRCRLSPL